MAPRELTPSLTGTTRTHSPGYTAAVATANGAPLVGGVKSAPRAVRGLGFQCAARGRVVRPAIGRLAHVPQQSGRETRRNRRDPVPSTPMPQTTGVFHRQSLPDGPASVQSARAPVLQNDGANDAQ